ncbi:hypothetical protein BG011_000307 [Mortierella polycephala]|uniref:F-box domain-containing protein n=1 Tax=Mortierella polycephala TaxID=41804 RepID=A0A9P6QA21_9FUNG|nr:hypothetical protein BG011_000307 [Mortierella polycephala]
MVSALDLPEIRTHIGQYLDPEDLTCCLLVSREWHSTFMPLLWKDVRIVGIHSVRADVNLRKHAHLVRSLSFLRILSLRHFQLVDRYNRLECLHVTKTDIDGRIVWEKLAGLVRQNRQTLRTVVLEDMMPMKEFLVSLASQDEIGLHDNHGEDAHKSDDKDRRASELQLQELAWKRVTVYASCLGHFWEASQGAESLVLECLTIKGTDTIGGPELPAMTPGSAFLGNLIPAGTTLSAALSTVAIMDSMNASTEDEDEEEEASTALSTGYIVQRPQPPPSFRKSPCKIQTLRVSWIIDLPLDLQLTLWIQPCTELRSLTWEAFTFPIPCINRFARLLATDTWPFLTSVEISSCVTYFPPDRCLAQLLDAGQKRSRCFESLVFRNVDFGPLAFNSLRRHFSSLKTLKWIACAAKVTSAMAREPWRTRNLWMYSTTKEQKEDGPADEIDTTIKATMKDAVMMPITQSTTRTTVTGTYFHHQQILY